MRYYLGYSTIFDDPQNIYDTHVLKKVIKNNGGKNIRMSNNYGYSNQPKVVTFNADNSTLINIKNALNKLPIFSLGCNIMEKYW